MMQTRNSYLKQLTNTFTKLEKLDGIQKEKNDQQKKKPVSRMLQLMNQQTSGMKQSSHQEK